MFFSILLKEMDMSISGALVAVKEKSWWYGLAILFRKENHAWWGTKKWWIQSLIWLAIINGFFAMMLWLIPLEDPEGAPPPSEVRSMYVIMFSIFTTIGVIVLSMSALVGEKKSGTAEWIMSNPVSRSAFVVSKFLANWLGIFIIIVLLQSTVFYLQFSLREGAFLSLDSYAATIGLLTLNLLFFLTLTLMLGAFFNSRGPVIGIALAVFIGQDIVSPILSNFWSWVPLIFPQALMEAAEAVNNGQPLPSIVPLILMPLLSLLFMLTAIWRFEREEF
jgi:ABC-2 type transport system permease protein